MVFCSAKALVRMDDFLNFVEMFVSDLAKVITTYKVPNLVCMKVENVKNICSPRLSRYTVCLNT